MTKPAAFALGLGLGAWTVPLANRIADRIAHRHYLSIDIKETP